MSSRRRYIAAAGAVLPALVLSTALLASPPGAQAEGVDPPKTLCASGAYSESGYAPCVEASPGHFVYGNGATAQEPCPAGTYAPGTGSSVCIPAFPGNYVPDIGAEAQLPCGAGTFNPSIGATECLPAGPGTYSAAEAIEPTECSPGAYAPGMESISCREAEPGHYVAEPGASSEVACELGSYAESSGSAECTAAAAGHYVAIVAAEEELPCAAGTHNPDLGAAECLNDIPGTYSAAGAETAMPCPAGAYAPAMKSTSCLEAQPGSYVPRPGASEQTPCEAGSFAESSGSAACTPAEVGYYVAEVGASTQDPCPSGETSSRGATHCDPALVEPSTDDRAETQAQSSGASDASSPPAQSANPLAVEYAILRRSLSFRVSCPAGGPTCSFAVSGIVRVPRTEHPIHLRRIAIVLAPGATRIVHLRVRRRARRMLRAHILPRRHRRIPRVRLLIRTSVGQNPASTRSRQVPLPRSVLR